MASSVAATNTCIAEKVLPLSSASNSFTSATAVMAGTSTPNSKIAEQAERQDSGVAADIVASEKKRNGEKKGKKSGEAEAEAGEETMEEGEGCEENNKKRVKAAITTTLTTENNNKFKFELPKTTQFTFSVNDEVIAAAEKMEYIKPSKPAISFGTQPAKPFEPLYTFELPKMEIKGRDKDFKLATYETGTAADFWKKYEAYLPAMERALVKVEDEDQVFATTEADEDNNEWKGEAAATALTSETNESSQHIYTGVVDNGTQLKLTQDYIRDVEAIYSSLATETKTSMSVIVRDIGRLRSSLDWISEEIAAIQDLALEIGKLRTDIRDSMNDIHCTFPPLSQEIKGVGAHFIDTLASLPEDLAAKPGDLEDESNSLTQVLFPQGNGRWDFNDMIFQAGRGGGGGGGWCNVM